MVSLSAAAVILGAAAYVALWKGYLGADWTAARLKEGKEASMAAIAVGGAGFAWLEYQKHRKAKMGAASGTPAVHTAAASKQGGDFTDAVRRYVAARSSSSD